ncbi:MAG: hypothetical protein ACE5HX_08195, partial [bacterium]
MNKIFYLSDYIFSLFGRDVRRLMLNLILALLTACGPSSPNAPKIKVENIWSWPVKVLGETMVKKSPTESQEGKITSTPEGGTKNHNMGSSTGVVYLTLINEGRTADR